MMQTLITTGAIAFLAVVAMTPVAASVARRVGLIDHPKADRAHSRATPYLGGVAILLGILVALAFVPRAIAQVAPRTNLAADFVGRQLAVLLAGTLAMGLIGLLDDWRPALPRWRILAEVLAAGAVAAAGIEVRISQWRPLNIAITIVWIVGITNATNLLDHMDGLASGAVAIAAAGTAFLAVDLGQDLVALVAIALCAASLGFLVHNRPPARIFMGDAGALSLGFLLATTVAKLELGEPGPVRVSVILLLCGLGVLDTVLVVVSRVSRRISPFTGGTDHSSHRLVRRGLRRSRAVLVMHGLGAVLVVAAILIHRVPGLAAVLVGLVTLVMVAAALAALLSLPSEGPLASEELNTA